MTRPFLARVMATLSRLIVEETDARLVVGSNAREDDKILLATLERIHGRHLDLGVQLLTKHARARHVLNDVRALTSYRVTTPSFSGATPAR